MPFQIPVVSSWIFPLALSVYIQFKSCKTLSQATVFTNGADKLDLSDAEDFKLHLLGSSNSVWVLRNMKSTSCCLTDDTEVMLVDTPCSL